MLKNILLYPTSDGTVYFKCVFDGILSRLLLEVGYTVGWENASILVSFQHQESNGELSWFGGCCSIF
jgi:hypothetical protein